MSATARGVIGARLGDARRPTMYASPIVLIFSRPWRSASVVELGEDLVRASSTSSAGGRPRRQLGEADEVAEQHRHVRERVGDRCFAALEALADRLRQHVEQELLGAGALAIELGL